MQRWCHVRKRKRCENSWNGAVVRRLLRGPSRTILRGWHCCKFVSGFMTCSSLSKLTSIADIHCAGIVALHRGEMRASLSRYPACGRLRAGRPPPPQLLPGCTNPTVWMAASAAFWLVLCILLECWPRPVTCLRRHLPASPGVLVEARRLSKSFSNVDAVVDTSFTCERGQCLGLLGTGVFVLYGNATRLACRPCSMTWFCSLHALRLVRVRRARQHAASRPCSVLWCSVCLFVDYRVA